MIVGFIPQVLAIARFNLPQILIILLIILSIWGFQVNLESIDNTTPVLVICKKPLKIKFFPCGSRFTSLIKLKFRFSSSYLSYPKTVQRWFLKCNWG